jgi:hypothetical protein
MSSELLSLDQYSAVKLRAAGFVFFRQVGADIEKMQLDGAWKHHSACSNSSDADGTLTYLIARHRLWLRVY